MDIKNEGNLFKKHIAKLLAIVIITIVLVAILLSQINPGDIITTLTNIDPIYLVIGFATYICCYFVRIIRFYILLNKKVSIKDLVAIVCVHNMANNILPARTGEVSYVYLAKKLHNISVGEGVASLMVARMFDYIAISLLFILSALSIKNLPDTVYILVWGIAALLIVVVFLLIGLLYFGKSWLTGVKKIVAALGVGHFRLIQYLLRKGEEMENNFKYANPTRVIVIAGTLSVFIFLLLHLVTFVLVQGMDLNLPIQYVIIGSTISILSVLFPIQGIGGFGTSNMGWVIGYMTVGVPKQIAITAGFSVHIISFIYTLILGVFGIVMLKINRHPNRTITDDIGEIKTEEVKKLESKEDNGKEE